MIESTLISKLKEIYMLQPEAIVRNIRRRVERSKGILREMTEEELQNMRNELIECVEHVVNTTKRDMEQGQFAISQTIESSFQATEESIIMSNELLLQQAAKIKAVAERQLRYVKAQERKIRVRALSSVALGMAAAVLVFFALLWASQLWTKWEMASMQEEVAKLNEQVENRQAQLKTLQTWGLQVVESNGLWWMLVPPELTLGPTQNLDDGRQAHKLLRR